MSGMPDPSKTWVDEIKFRILPKGRQGRSAQIGGALNLSLRELLGRSYLPYLEQVVVPELERLTATSQVPSHVVAKVSSLVSEKGIGVLEPTAQSLDEVTLNTAGSGYLVQAELRLTEDVSLRHLIKRFDGEDFGRAVDTQQRIYRALVGTDLEGMVPEPTFVDPKERIMVTPFVEGGTLKEQLDQDSGNIFREAILKEVLQDYLDLSRRINQPEIKRDLALPGFKRPFATFFEQYYFGGNVTDNEAFIELFTQEVTSELDRANDTVIHGDLHTKQVLRNGKSVFLDWPRAVATGYMEYDTAKLLTKADLPFGLEEKLARDFATKAYETEDERQASYRRFVKTKIMEELFGAKRYLRRAEKCNDKKTSKKLADMANVMFNSSIRIAQRATREGIVSPELAVGLLHNSPRTENYSTAFIDDLQYHELKTRCNPHEGMSFENAAVPAPLETIVEDAKADNVGQIKRAIRKAKRRRRYGPIAATLGVLAIGFAVAFGAQRHIDSRVEETRKITTREASIDTWTFLSVTRYQDIFEDAFQAVTTDLASGKTTESLHMDDLIIEETAQKYGLEKRLLLGMLKVNRYHSGVDRSFRHEYLPNVNILDPIEGYRETIGRNGVERVGVNMHENLDSGAERIAGLIKKHEGNVDAALLEFYDPITYTDSPHRETQLEMMSSHTTEEELVRTRRTQRQVAYSANHGMGVDMPAVVGLLYLRTPPEHFPYDPPVVEEPTVEEPVFTEGISDLREDDDPSNDLTINSIMLGEVKYDNPFKKSSVKEE